MKVYDLLTGGEQVDVNLNSVTNVSYRKKGEGTSLFGISCPQFFFLVSPS